MKVLSHPQQKKEKRNEVKEEESSSAAAVTCTSICCCINLIFFSKWNRKGKENEMGKQKGGMKSEKKRKSK